MRKPIAVWIVRSPLAKIRLKCIRYSSCVDYSYIYTLEPFSLPSLANLFPPFYNMEHANKREKLITPVTKNNDMVVMM